jgi:hypothetical protein
MSKHPNHRRGEKREQDNGPTFESHTPSAGCNSTHVARSRKKWKRRAARSERRTGTMTPKVHRPLIGGGRPRHDDEP